MTAFVYSIVLVIASQATYQLAMRSMPAGIRPLAMVIAAYAVAIAACIVVAPLAGAAVSLADFRRLVTWQTALLALSVVGIEIGYLLAYRSGWKLGITFAVASSATVATLAVLGIVLFREHLEVRRVIGLALVLAGGWFIVG